MKFIFGILSSILIIQAALGADPTPPKESIKVKTRGSNGKNKETVAINVQTEKIERDAKGNFEDAELLKVSLQVSVVKGKVTVNDMKAMHGSVTAFHFHAEIDEIGRNKEVLKHQTYPVIIRVLVLEENIQQQSGASLTRLVVEAQIVEIYKKTVREIDVTQLLIKLDKNKKELTREVTLIKIKSSKIQHHAKINDTDVHKQGGKLPGTKYSATKDQMDEFHHRNLGPPMKPKNPYHAPKTSFGGKVDHYENSICKGFYKLPFAARLSIFLLVTFIGLLTLFCCIRAFCCKPPATGKKFLEDYDNKCEFEIDMDAPPLDTKIPLDKHKLVIDA